MEQTLNLLFAFSTTRAPETQAAELRVGGFLTQDVTKWPIGIEKHPTLQLRCIKSTRMYFLPTSTRLCSLSLISAIQQNTGIREFPENSLFLSRLLPFPVTGQYV